MWLLPTWFPFHPGNMWCHSRMVYLPMGYIYGTRFTYDGAAPAAGGGGAAAGAAGAAGASSSATVDPIIAELRQELYSIDYQKICWNSYRHAVADIDNYSPITWYMRAAHNLLSWYEWCGGCRCLRTRGLAYAIDYIHAEDVSCIFFEYIFFSIYLLFFGYTSTSYQSNI